MPTKPAAPVSEVENHYHHVSMAKHRPRPLDNIKAKLIIRILRCITMIKTVTITTIRINTMNKILITTTVITMRRSDKHRLVESRVSHNIRNRMPSKNRYLNVNMNRIFPRRPVRSRPMSCRILTCGIRIQRVPSRIQINWLKNVRNKLEKAQIIEL